MFIYQMAGVLHDVFDALQRYAERDKTCNPHSQTIKKGTVRL